MNMGLGLYQEQTLKLVMTPELRQAITILQYSAVDLISYLQEQANENPVFDLEAAGEVASTKAEKPAPEIDWKEIVGNRASGEYSVAKNESTYNPLDYVQQGSDSLYEHLERQLGYVKGFSPLQKQIALFIIGNLDEKGYLEITLEEASAALGADLLEIEDVLSVLQHFTWLEWLHVAWRNVCFCNWSILPSMMKRLRRLFATICRTSRTIVTSGLRIRWDAPRRTCKRWQIWFAR